MSMQSRFVVCDFQLEVNHDAYLVEVSPLNGAFISDNSMLLPEWVVYSRHAIWLTKGNKPLAERAIEGDQIKGVLLRKLSPTLPETDDQGTFVLPGALQLIALHSKA